MLLINKPKGWTSFDAVAYIRGRVKRANCHPEHSEGSLKPTIRDSSVAGFTLSKANVLPQNDKRKQPRVKVGHAGTLDPFATGLLIVAVGREETKHLDDYKNLPKTYVATIRLGATSDTMDSTGKILDFRFMILDLQNDDSQNLKSKIINHKSIVPTRAEAETTLASFKGKQLQLPPMFSAKSIGGVRLYKLARKGIEVERQPNEIEILDIKLLNYNYPFLKIEVSCSAGTYIRTLAHDIGQKLGVGAYCEELVRIRIGKFKLEDAQELSAIDFNLK